MTESKMRVIAVDWSGEKGGGAKTIWLAEAADGQIVRLENGRARQQLISDLIYLAARNPNIIVGFDFAFGMPAWFMEQQGAKTGPEFWELVAQRGKIWLETRPWPFYGHKGTKKPLDCILLRNTEAAAQGAKSVFQINGAGAVGVGSIRGMPHLTALRTSGWSIWPFDPPGFPMVIEIYPRLLMGAVVKSIEKERLDYLTKNFPELDPRSMERAAGSEHAFDAAVSSLVMDKNWAALQALPNLSRDPIDQLEGRIWHPSDKPLIPDRRGPS